MITSYHAKYFAYELTRRYSSDSLQKLAHTLSDAQVDLNPHQVEAALFAFRSPFSQGAILADEVGLGKTIEAGILISQKWAEKKRKLLIIVPSNLRKQWNQELLDKFFLPSVIMEKKSFEAEIAKGNFNPFEQDNIYICSYHFARAKDSYIRAITWDLVVIDEAHKLRNVYKPSNKIGNAIKNALIDKPKVLLTATPLQNSILELFGLVSVVDKYVFGDLKSFKSQFTGLTDEQVYEELKRRIKPICKRTLRRQVLEYVKYTKRVPITQEFMPSADEQRLYNLVTDYLQRPALYALPSSQRQLMTLILRRLLASSTYAISGTLEALAGKLEETIRNQNTPVDMEPAVAENYEEYDELKDEWTEEDEEENETKQYTPEELEVIKKETILLKEFQALAESIKKNSKGEVLLKALNNGLEMTKKLGAREKALIFTESTRTQKYIFEILEATEYKGKILIFNGSNTDPKSREIYAKWLERNKGTDRVTGSKTADMRSALIEHFRDEDIIMIATEAGAEGINLQFCSLVINYDLPWNPQRIEQRIGRCHRYGQKHDVVVVNFLNLSNAADQRVYKLLADKFRLFEGVFGASDEVLGTIESGVDFEKRIAVIYQNCRTEEQIQQAFDELQRDMETTIDENVNRAKKQLLENFDEEVTEKLRINKDVSEDYLTRYEDWLWRITQFYLAPYAQFSDDRLFTLKSNPFSGEPINPGPYRMGKNIEDVNTYRAGHPLAQRIIDNCKTTSLPVRELVFDYSNSGKNIYSIKEIQGKSGYMSLTSMTISAFEPQDTLIFSGTDDSGNKLSPELCSRLFSLDAVVADAEVTIPEDISAALEQAAYAQETDIVSDSMARNSDFFEEEMTKLDYWAEDIKESLELELKELDRDIKTKKTETKKLLKLEEKVAAQRHIKDMEKRRNELRQNLYIRQDEVEKKKEEIISETEKRMKQSITKEKLFTIRWKVI